MGKYFSNSNDGVFAQDGGACSTKAASDGAVVYDPPSHTPPVIIRTDAQMCWKVSGRAVIIADRYYSNQAGFEMANFNMHTDGSQPPVPSQYHLPFSAIV